MFNGRLRTISGTDDSVGVSALTAGIGDAFGTPKVFEGESRGDGIGIPAIDFGTYGLTMDGMPKGEKEPR